MSTDNMTLVSLKMHPDTIRQVKRVAGSRTAETGRTTTFSEVVREAVHRYLRDRDQHI
jgi:hypothetical protein